MTLVVVAEIEGESSDSVSYEIALTFPARPTQQQLISRLKERGLFFPGLAIFLKPKAGPTRYLRLQEEVLPWDKMAVDANGCYRVKLAPEAKPSPPTTPERSLPAGRTRISESSIELADLAARLQQLGLQQHTDAAAQTASLDDVVRYLKTNEGRSDKQAWQLLEPPYLELPFVGRHEVLKKISEQAVQLYQLATADDKLGRKSDGASFPTVFVSAGRGKTRFMLELKQKLAGLASAGVFGPPKAVLVLAAAFGHSVLGEYTMDPAGAEYTAGQLLLAAVCQVKMAHVPRCGLATALAALRQHLGVDHAYRSFCCWMRPTRRESQAGCSRR